jgi:two-component system sensor histidine kinase/response regulator
MDGYLCKPMHADDLFRAVEGLGVKMSDTSVVKHASVMDLQTALEHLDGDAELLAEVAGIFLEDYPRFVADIQDAVARRDAPALARHAHGLKGSVANFGATAAFQAALRLEDLARQGDLSEAESVLNDLTQALEQLKGSLVEIRDAPQRGQILSPSFSLASTG